MANNGNISVLSSSQLNILGGGIGITNGSGSNGALTNGGVVDVYKATGGTNLQCIPVVNGLGGSFIVGDGNGTNTKLEIKGSNPLNGVSFYNSGGGVTLNTGANLMADSGFTQQAGALAVSGKTGIAAFLCYSQGNVVINGGSVGFNSTNLGLVVGNNYSMTGGSLNITIDATAGTLDGITSNAGNISINNGCTINVTTINVPPGGMPNEKWFILVIANGNGVVTVGSRVNFQ